MAALFFDIRVDKDFIWFRSALEAEALVNDRSLYWLSIGEKNERFQILIELPLKFFNGMHIISPTLTCA